jgi:uncharacterized protein with GYD domain
MPTYISLINWTDQGIRDAKNTVARVEQARGVIERMGGSLRDVFWTQGRYDIVAVMEWPDDASATAFLLALGGQGNVRSETLRAFNAEEMGRVLEKLPPG